MKLRRKREEDDDPWADDWAGLDEAWDEDGDDARPTRRRLWAVLAVALLAGGLVWFLLARPDDARPAATPIAAAPTVVAPTAAATAVAATPVATMPVAATPVATTPTPPALPGGITRQAVPDGVTPAPYDPAALAGFMLDLINADRAAAGLAPVAWDDTAAAAAAAHAADMVAGDYFSHWNLAGLGPDHRYSAAGGDHAVMENLYAFSYTYADGRAAPIEDWPELIRNAQLGLMESPGHRANILDPPHSHVGIGLAYDPATGRFRLAQEFTNQVATLSAPLPAAARPGDTLRVAGAFGPAAVGNAILDLSFEPLPTPLTVDEVAARSTYASPAESVTTRGIPLTFDETLLLPAAPGLYHVRLFVDLVDGQALVVDHVVAVR